MLYTKEDIMQKQWDIKLILLLCAVMMACVLSPLRASEIHEARLIAVLKSDAPKAEKAITCKRLVIFGSKEAVPALATLLPDAELTSWARTALEAIPGPEAAKALQDALDRTTGRTLVGVINSIGVRQDAGAAGALYVKLKDKDAAVAEAAAVALGCIGTPTAARSVAGALTDGRLQVRSGAAEGCILCAEKLLEQSKPAEAALLYQAVREAAVPKQRLLEATRGFILTRQAGSLALLKEGLLTKDRRAFAMALTTARELDGSDVSKILAETFRQAAPARQPLILMALADRKDPSVLPVVLQAVKEGNGSMQLAAVNMLRQLGDVSCVPVLLDAAVNEDAALAAAAKNALAGLSGDGVNAALAKRLSGAQGKLRHVLIALAGLRRVEGVAAILKKASLDDDASIRAASLEALGLTIGPKDLPFLIKRVVKPKDKADAQAAEKALKTACLRMPDREACAAELTDTLWDMPLTTQSTVVKKRWDPSGKWRWTPVSPKSTLLEILGEMGGKKALDTMQEAAVDDDAELRDTALYVLGQWVTPDAAPALLTLARKAPGSNHRILALRGYIRIAKVFDLPVPEKAKICAATLKLATRNEERNLALDVVKAHPSLEMLLVATEAAKIPALKDAASDIALKIAQKVKPSEDVKKMLAQIGFKPVSIEIIKAEYGVDGKFKDVSAALRRHVGSFPVITLPSNSYNNSLGGDPVPGIVKKLKIRYRYNGKEGSITFAENDPILLPVPK